MLATLVRAETSYFEGYGLRGFLVIEQNKETRTYAFRLPTAEEPDPPGWTSVARLTQVTNEAVIAAWQENGQVNDVATEALRDITARLAGEAFVVSEVLDQTTGLLAPDLVQIDVHIAAPQNLVELEEAAPEPTVARYSFASQVRVDIATRSADPAVFVVIIGPSEAPETELRFRVPDWNDQTPDGWWFIETVTGVSHQRIAKAWERGKNPVLDDTVQLFGQAITGYPVPIRTDGQVDLVRWRRSIVKGRAAQGFKPFVFLDRPDHNTEHTRAIFYDLKGDYLFRANAAPGISGRPALIINNNKKVVLQHLDHEVIMRGHLIRSIRFVKSGRPPKACEPPPGLLSDLTMFPDRSWPGIQGIVRIPTVRTDGSVIMQPGYDLASQLWYAPEFQLENIPDQPSREDCQKAKALIMTPLAEFPFIDVPSCTAAVACLFEQIVRPMIRGPRPFYIFDAPELGQGSGKTLLAKVIQGIITGKMTPATSGLGKREEEIEKRITVLLKQQEPLIICDNLTSDVESEALQQLATSESWQARLLNTNEAPIYPQNATWVLTLNAAKMNRDIARRSILSRLDSGVANAWERTGFKIKDVYVWSRERRASIIRACIILARAWVVAGRPVDARVVRGSFEGWCEVIGGILMHAGFEGLHLALAATNERDIHTEEHRLLIHFWRQEYALGQPLPSSVIGALAAKHQLYEARLPKLARGSSLSPLGRAMLKILRGGLLGKGIDGYRIDQHPTLQDGYTCYVLSPASAPARPVLGVINGGEQTESETR